MIIEGSSKAFMYHEWRVKLDNFILFPNFMHNLPISLDLRSKKSYLSKCFENGPNGKSKVFS